MQINRAIMQFAALLMAEIASVQGKTFEHQSNF